MFERGSGETSDAPKDIVAVEACTALLVRMSHEFLDQLRRRRIANEATADVGVDGDREVAAAAAAAALAGVQGHVFIEAMQRRDLKTRRMHFAADATTPNGSDAVASNLRDVLAVHGSIAAEVRHTQQHEKSWCV